MAESAINKSEGASLVKAVSRTIRSDYRSPALLYSLHVEHQGELIFTRGIWKIEDKNKIKKRKNI